MRFDKELFTKILNDKTMRSRRTVAKKYGLSERVASYYWFMVQNHDRVHERRVLIVGDLHAPFVRYGYLEFCKQVYYKYDCNEVVMIGDLIDNHFSSYHEIDPDGHGAGAELQKAKEEISNWYKAFPKAKVCTGNHDAIPYRKAMTAGLSSSWIKSISEVIDVPNWEFGEEFVIDGNRYCHGTGRKARIRAKDDMMSIIQGHYHSESYIEHFVGHKYRIFAMQIGCGVDDKSYAMAYGKHFKKMIINCGVILENGELPILEFMKL